MKRIVLFFTVLTVAILSACGAEGGTQSDPGLPAMLEVDLRLPEENLDPGAEVIIEAYVSQGEEPVEDATEVVFEILRAGDEESEKFDGEHQGDGIYTARKVFAEDGTYSVTAHVTARDFHNMPTKDLVIGNPSEANENTDHDQGHEHGTNEETDTDHTDEHHGDVSVELQSGLEMNVNEEIELSVFISEKDQPLTGAKISFEVWQENEEQHEFIDAVESGSGVYKVKTSFDAVGTYLVNVHINTDHLHEHQLFTVTVK